jgi:hypothetical protein
LQQQQGQAASQLTVQRLQNALGQPAQREWVLTCGPLPHLPHHSAAAAAAAAAEAQQPFGGTSSSSTPGTAAGLNPGSLQGQPQGSAQRLKPAVALAVAGRGGGGVGSTGGSLGGGGGGPAAPVPPSRLYVQEADGEMRLATVLVSQAGR